MIQNGSICNGVARAAYACSLAVRPILLRPNAADVDHYQSKCANTRRACSVAVLDEDVACSVAVLFSSMPVNEPVTRQPMSIGNPWPSRK